MSEVSEVRGVASAAQVVLTQAGEYCAQKMKLHGTQTVMDRLMGGDGEACGYFHYTVAKQVAQSLAAMDGNIKAAYVYDYDATPEDLCFGQGGRALPIHLLVWVERKTAALKALMETWDRALAQRYAELSGGNGSVCLLDAQVVDDVDVEKRIGYGALLSSLHRPPLQVWKR